MLTEVQYPEKVNFTVVINVVFDYNFVSSMVRWICFCVYVSRNVYVNVYIHVYKMNAHKNVYVHFTYVILISTLFFFVEITNKQNRAPNYLQCFEEGLAKVDSMILASVSKLRGQQKVVEEYCLCIKRIVLVHIVKIPFYGYAEPSAATTSSPTTANYNNNAGLPENNISWWW